MVVMSIQDADALFSSEGVRRWIEDLKVRLPKYGDAFSTLKDSGQKTALARFLAGVLLDSCEGGVLVYVTQSGVWPSSEHPDLFEGYRRGMGEQRNVADAPLHLFTCTEQETLVSVLCLILYFFWDAELVSMNERCLITLNHDEWLEIRTNSDSLREFCKTADGGYLRPLVT